MQVDVGTELNWLAFELVVKYTKEDKDLCRAASRAVDVLRNNNYTLPEKRIEIMEKLKKEVAPCR